LTQVSEFSLIIALQGLTLGHISADVFSITATIALFTFTLASYLITFDQQIYSRLSKYLTHFEKLSNKKHLILEDIPITTEKHTIVCGGRRMGSHIFPALQKLKHPFVVVDYNPEIILSLMKEGVPCIYGDVGDVEVLEKVNLKNADMIFSTIDNEDDNLVLLLEAKSANKKTKVFLTANTVDEALELYDVGADYVIIPDILSGKKVADVLMEHINDPHVVERARREHVQELEASKEKELLTRYEPEFMASLARKFGHKRAK